MIRFSAFLVVAAVGTLVGGVVTSKLLLVYIAIGVSGLALLALGVGAAVNWRELTGKPQTAGAQASGAQADAAPAPQPRSPPPSAPQTVPSRVATPEPAQAPAVPAVTGTTTASRAPWSASVPAGSSRSGYLPPPEPPPTTRPAGPSGWERRDAPVPPPSQPPAQEPVAPAPPAPTRSEDRGESSAPDDDVSIQDQTLIFRAQDLAPAGRHGEAAPPPARASRAGLRARARRRARASRRARAAEPEPTPPTPPEPEPDTTPATDTTPADDDSTPAGKAATAGDRESTDDATTVTEAAGPEPDLEVTVVPGVPRYHKSQCILIRFMGDSDLDKMTMAAAREAGCTPCRACLPDQSDGPSE